MTKSAEIEENFATNAREAGFKVENPIPIRCLTPVEDKDGRKKKTITLPDRLVIDPKTNRFKHVEITSGNGDSRHKASQRRVAEAAGQIDNYVLVTGDIVKELHEKPNQAEKRAFILTIFGWLLLI